MCLIRVEHAGAATAPPVWRIYRYHPVAGPDVGAPPAASRALPARDDHGDYDKLAVRDRPGGKSWYKRMEAYVGTKKESYNRCAC
jgi:hypothetical protein